MRWQGTGLISDELDPRDYPIGSLLGVYSEPPPDFSFASLRFYGLDQGRIGACVAFAAAQTVWIRLRAMGVDRPTLLSARALYRDVAAIEQSKPPVVADLGCRPRNAWERLRKGVIAWDEWPWDEQYWHVEPPYRLRRYAADRDWLRYYRIESTDGQRISEIKQTLASGRPISLGLTLDATFDHHDGRHPWERRQSADGRHMVTAVGYDDGGVWIANSWGERWGLRGLGWISWRTIESPETTDLTVPEIDLRRL